eukprot:9482609-Pyramimonas_sp.AAC.2
MVTVLVTEVLPGGTFESNTTNSTSKVVSTSADTLRQPLRPLVANSCPGHPIARQEAGGQASTLLVRFPSSASAAAAPSSHRKLSVGATPGGH